jgi:SOS-response transcriptional repressor LexA
MVRRDGQVGGVINGGSRHIMRTGFVSHHTIEFGPHLSEGLQMGLDPLVTPTPPGGLGDADAIEDIGHADAVTGRRLFDGKDFGRDLAHVAKNVQECTVSQCANARPKGRSSVHYPAMAEPGDLARTFLTEALRVSGLKPYALAKKAGVAPTTITRPLNDPTFPFTPKAATLQKIATAAGVAVPTALATMAALRPETTELPLIGPVQAGAWLLIDDTAQDEPTFLTAALDRRYPHARQWLREVRGDSMNARQIFPGDLAHIVDLGEAGINLNTGMIVEVTRYRDGGSLREITLKEVEVTDGGLTLWPRSTNPRWAEAVQLDDGASGDVEVQITGLLLAAIRRF